jgi:hypothetical protein
LGEGSGGECQDNQGLELHFTIVAFQTNLKHGGRRGSQGVLYNHEFG